MSPYGITFVGLGVISAFALWYWFKQSIAVGESQTIPPPKERALLTIPSIDSRQKAIETRLALFYAFFDLLYHDFPISPYGGKGKEVHKQFDLLIRSDPRETKYTDDEYDLMAHEDNELIKDIKQLLEELQPKADRSQTITPQAPL